MIRIGCGAGAFTDRMSGALTLAEKGNLDYLIFETLAERTIAQSVTTRENNPELGYNPLLEERFELLLPIMQKNKFRVVTNMGAANPIGAGRKIVEIAKRLGCSVKVAVVTGDDVLEDLTPDMRTMEYDEPVDARGPIVSANAYIGVEQMLPALQSDAQVIITGRCADPSLTLAPLVYEYGWKLDDWDLLAAGTVAGHLLECGAQVTGGYYADPGKKDVPDLEHIGYPIAEVEEDGTFVITKVEGTGGLVDLGTVREQLLYEITNPHAYLTPDVSAVFTTLHLEEIGTNRVKVTGVTGNPRPETLKVSVGYRGGFIGEGRVIIGGPNVIERAKLGAQTVLDRTKGMYSEVRVDYVGYNSLHGDLLSAGSQPYEIMLRMACRTDTYKKADYFGNQVALLCLTGLGGAGGLWHRTIPVLGIVSVLIDRSVVKPCLTIFSTEEEAK